MKRAELTHERVFQDRAFADRYARKHWKMAEKFGHEYASKLASRGVEQGRVLDVGCGFGATILTLLQKLPGCSAVGIDLSDPLLELAGKAARHTGLDHRATFERADVQQIPYDDNTFQVVINANMVHLVADPVRMLDEMERVLVPDGFLFIADLRRSWLGLIEREIRSSLSATEAKALIARSGLRSGAFSAGPLWWRFESPA